ncbi:MAG: hypothetical protein BWY15_02091 [Firmicutes bacterium ADurb.Bin193]|jgi:TRAP-type uncharacterized transport system substrate-binding protein|nr:MAG: hypothetical protein BWY15_02091 [Firmicutes bacterium ADurb.Bin193]
MKNKNQALESHELEAILDEQIRALSDESIQLDNKLFTRQCQKSKELANLAGKKIAIIGQQLYANEMGAQIAVPSLGITEGQIILAPKNKIAKMLN